MSEMNKDIYIKRKKKATLIHGFLTVWIGLLFSLCIILSLNAKSGSFLEFFWVLGNLLLGFGLLLFLCEFWLTASGTDFIPEHKLGDILIYNRFSYNTYLWDYDFSQNDRIVQQIPHYQVEEIGLCSYLMREVNGIKLREVRFSDQKNVLFTPESFRQRGKYY